MEQKIMSHRMKIMKKTQFFVKEVLTVTTEPSTMLVTFYYNNTLRV